jgi:hypothetical protein
MLNPLTILSVASVICALNWSHTKRAGLFGSHLDVHHSVSATASSNYRSSILNNHARASNSNREHVSTFISFTVLFKGTLKIRGTLSMLPICLSSTQDLFLVVVRNFWNTKI